MIEKIEEDEKLPKYNPEIVCPGCGKKYRIWKPHLFFGEEKTRLAHNFCPASTAGGKIISICVECKMAGLKASREKDMR